MTQRLYYEDPYLKEFDAIVTGCVRKEDQYLVTLDRSAFFPEGGGQSGDRGILVRQNQETVRVLDTRESGEEIAVICPESFSLGEKVRGILDWTWRFDRMQNHSGEHIVSGLVHETYGFNNIGFHMSQDRMTIDLDGEIPEEGLTRIEKRANEIVWENVPVRTDLYTPEEAGKVEYRSKKELSGEIRVVSIPGADVCACCGTHVARTGEIGLVKILSHERCKGGVRMELACGRWAYEYLEQVFRQNHEVSMHLSSRMLKTGEAACRLVEENIRLKGSLVGMRYQMIDRKAEEMTDAGNVLIFMEDADAVMAQKLTAKAMETCKGSAFTFAGSDSEGYKYAAGHKDGDLKELVREMNAALDGRGGGKPFFQQGSVHAAREEIEAWLKERLGQLAVSDFL